MMMNSKQDLQPKVFDYKAKMGFRRSPSPANTSSSDLLECGGSTPPVFETQTSAWRRGAALQSYGTCSSGMGVPAKRRRHPLAMSRAHCAARATRALSVAIPVFAYICR